MKKLFWFFIIILIIILIFYFFKGGGKWEENVIIVDSQGVSSYPAMAWDGSGYGIVWVDSRDGDYPYDTNIYFARIDEHGKKLTDDISISSNISSNPLMKSKRPDIAYSGSEYGIVWENGGSLYFNRLDFNGNEMGDDIVVAPSTGHMFNRPRNAVIKWIGNGYGILWDSSSTASGYDRALFFTRLSPVGEKETGNILISGGEYEYNEFSSMDWLGSGYGAVWTKYQDNLYDGQVVNFARFNADGVRQTEDIKINNTTTARWQALFSSMAWNGSDENFGIVWNEADADDAGQIHFAIVDSNGGKQVENMIITSDIGSGYHHSSSTIIWSDDKSEYGVIWRQKDAVASGSDSIQFASFDKDGNRKGEIIQISDPESDYAYSGHPEIVWNGRKYAAVWDSSVNASAPIASDNGTEIHFATQSSCLITDILGDIKDFISNIF